MLGQKHFEVEDYCQEEIEDGQVLIGFVDQGPFQKTQVTKACSGEEIKAALNERFRIGK